jgi:MFS transporter, DHA3 family, macrolide efflux protein
MNKMASVFRERNFTKLFFAAFTSQMGGTIGLTAFMFYLLHRYSNQPVYATITELMFSLPTLAVFFMVGVAADRLDRQKVALYCDWICAGISLLFIISLIIQWIPLTFALLFIRSAVRNFFSPAESAIIQGILTPEDYTTAAGLNQMVSSLFMLFGSGLGIFCYWHFGIRGAILIDVLGFIISGFLIKSCRLSKEVRLPNGYHSLRDLNFSFVLRDFKVGILYILKNKLLVSLICGFIVFGIINGAFSVMQVFILKYKLEPNHYEEYSIVLGIVFGAGVLAGSVIASMLAQKMKLYKMLVLGLLLSGAATAWGALVPSTMLYLISSGAVALSLPMINVAIGGWMPSIVDPKMMGRVQGWVNPLMMMAQSVTLLLIAGFYPKYITVESLFWLVGSCLFLVGIFYSIILPRFIKKNAPLQTGVHA